MVFSDGLETLSEHECRHLLARREVGRLAVTVAALPAIFPVNYALLDDDIVFLTGEGTKLRAAAGGAVVAFQVDEIDPATRTGWSVLVVGMAGELTDPADLDRVATLGLQPWAPGRRHHVVRLRTELVSGRRIVPHPTLAGPVIAPAT